MRYVSCSWAEGGLSCDNGSDHPQQLSSTGAFDSQESTDPSFWSSSALHPTSFNAALLDCGLLFNSLVAASSNIGNDYNPDALTSSLPCHWDLDLTLTVHSLAAATQRKEEALRDAGSEHNQSSGDNMLLVQPQVRHSMDSSAV